MAEHSSGNLAVEGCAFSCLANHNYDGGDAPSRDAFPQTWNLTLVRPQVTLLPVRRSAVVVAAAIGHVGSVLSPELASPVRPSCADGSAAHE
jgi:hypothetical protein